MIDKTKSNLWDALGVDLGTFDFKELSYKKANTRIVFDVITSIIKMDPSVVSTTCGKYIGRGTVLVNYINGTTLAVRFHMEPFSGYGAVLHNTVKDYLKQLRVVHVYDATYSNNKSLIFTIK